MSQTIEMNHGNTTPEADAKTAEAVAAAAKRGEEVEIYATDNVAGEKKVVADIKPSDVPKRPDNVPEKFWNAESGTINTEALLKSQQDAEAALSRLQSEKPAETPSETPSEEPKAETPTDAPAPSNAVEAAAKEFSEKGSLASETYEALAKQGISKDMVDAQIAGAKAVEAESQKLTDATFDEVGGETNFTAMAEWAAKDLDAGQVATINTLLGSPDEAVVRAGAAQLKAAYEANADIDPSVVLTGHTPATTGKQYNSKAEMTRDMNDPRYKNDTAFQAEVAAKISRTPNGVLFG